MYNLQVINSNGVNVVNSCDVAEMVSKPHCDLMKSIRTYIQYLGQGNFPYSDFFIESTYVNEQNKQQPCYLITKKGCDMVANKMTGEKGVLFTAAYVTKFSEMEQSLKQPLQGLSPQLQFMINVELQQKEQAKAIAKVESKVEKLETVIETFSQPIVNGWCDEMNTKINKMCMNNNLNYQKFRGELYNELEVQANCNLETRRKRLRERMDKAGAKYVDRMAVNKLHVIDSDNKLKLIFEGIVRKYQMRYAG